MVPKAYLVHRTRQRVRLRVPEKRGDADWFGQAAAALEQLDWVGRTEAGALSASLVLHCEATDRLDVRLSQIGLFEFQGPSPPGPTAVEQVMNGLVHVDRALQSSASGSTDVRSLLFLLMLVLAAVQLARGRVLVPAISFLWYAIDLALGSTAVRQQQAEAKTDEPP